jgi:hypothetical protein
VNPKSEQECESWKADYYGYLKQQENDLQQCMRANDSATTVQSWVSADICSAIRINFPPPCASLASQWHCDSTKFGSLLNTCFAAARQAKDAAKENDPSRDLLSKTADGVPKVAGTNAMRMADLLADQGQASASKAAIQSAIKAYKTTDFISSLYKAYDPSQPPAQRLAAITGFMSKAAIGNNPLAQDMLKTALTGLIDTNQTALDRLLRDLDAFSAQIGQENAAAVRQAIEEAKAEEARRANERRTAEEAAKRRAARERQLADERAKAAEDLERQRQEKLRAAQRDRELLPRREVQSAPPVRYCTDGCGHCDNYGSQTQKCIEFYRNQIDHRR